MIGKRKEKISSIELWAAMCLYTVSVSMIAPIGTSAEMKSWISIIAGTILALVFTLIYAHLSDSHSGKSFDEIGEVLIGKWGGKVIGLLYAWFSFEICSYMMKDSWQITTTVALPNTPKIVIAIAAIIFVAWIAYGGIEIISRLSIIFIPVLVFYLVIAFILLSKDFDFGNFLPIADIKWREVLFSSFQISVHPLSVSIIFVVAFTSLNKKGRAKKPAIYSVAAAGLLIFFLNIMYLLVLGPLAPKLTYPGYTAFSYIQVADFLDRAEILFYTLFISINIIQMSVALYVTAIYLARVFGLNDYRVLLIPLGFLVVELSTFIVRSHAEHINIVEYSWPFYAMIYEVLIPLILLIFSAIRKKRGQTA